MRLPENISWRPSRSDECYDNTSEHAEMSERLRKTLYYGKTPKMECLSLPVTEIAVEYFRESSPCELGKLDHYLASSYSRNACMSSCALMLSFAYIERLRRNNAEYLQKVSSADLFLISMMVASKYLYDEGVDEEVFNDEWAKSANLDLKDLNELERDFLNAIEWELFISTEQFLSILNTVEEVIALNVTKGHGFYSYTDLLVLLRNVHLQMKLKDVINDIVKMLTVFSVAYVAGTITLVGSGLALDTIRTLDTRTILPSAIPLIRTVGFAEQHNIPPSELRVPPLEAPDYFESTTHYLAHGPLPAILKSDLFNPPIRSFLFPSLFAPPDDLKRLLPDMQVHNKQFPSHKNHLLKNSKSVKNSIPYHHTSTSLPGTMDKLSLMELLTDDFTQKPADTHANTYADIHGQDPLVCNTDICDMPLYCKEDCMNSENETAACFSRLASVHTWHLSNVFGTLLPSLVIGQ